MKHASLERKSARYGVFLTVLIGFGITLASATAQTVAHWSYNTPTLTLESGNITVAGDSTGNHNAFVSPTGIGGGTGDQYISAPFASTASVAGRFGEALRFNGDNFMLFNNLTELMEANGAPSYTISMWVNAQPGSLTSALPFATLANWGLTTADAGPTRFVYAFGPGGSTTMRAQSRREEPGSGGGGTNGDDIFADNATTPAAIDDAMWHMLSWTFDTTTGTLTHYFDGSPVETVVSTDPSFAMANSASGLGAMGLKGDNGILLPADFLLDEVWVVTGALNEAQIGELFSMNVIPEPSFFALLGIGALVFSFRRRA